MYIVHFNPNRAHAKRALASCATILAEKGLSIRQAIVDDPELSPEPKLVLIVEKKIPGELIPKLLSVNGVAKVGVY